MEAKNQDVRRLRLQFAICLVTEPNGDPEVNKEVLKSLCKDPVIREVLKLHGVEVPK